MSEWIDVTDKPFPTDRDFIGHFIVTIAEEATYLVKIISTNPMRGIHPQDIEEKNLTHWMEIPPSPYEDTFKWIQSQSDLALMEYKCRACGMCVYGKCIPSNPWFNILEIVDWKCADCMHKEIQSFDSNHESR